MVATTITIRRRLLRRKALFSITGWLATFAGVVMIGIGEEAPNPIWLYAGWATLALGVIVVTSRWRASAARAATATSGISDWPR
jgi:hypothetical protein